MYKIIGGDQKEYGPVSADQIRQWIAEGRANPQTKVQAEDSADWLPLSAFPEFADALAAQTLAPPPPLAETGTSSALPPDFFTHDYTLDIGACVGNGWSLFKNNFGVLFVGALICLLIEGAIALLGAVPFIGPLFSLANFFIVGPLMGGVYYLFLRTLRRQPASAGDVFAGFTLNFVQLCLGYLAVALLVCVCMLPGGVVAAVSIVIPMIRQRSPDALHIAAGALGFLICLIPAVYLSVSWIFALPLIVDKRMNFWAAMEASRKRVGKHWWLVFGFLIVCGLIKVAGILACGIGVLFALPITIAALMYAYECLFGSSPP
jgi:uncharacterized membrane protein